MLIARRAMGILALGLVLGCGPSETKSIKAAGGTTPAEQLKFALQNIATSGEVGGSGFGEVQERLDQLKAKDPAKAGAVEKDIQDLGKLSDPAKVKAKAQEIIGKL